MSGFKLLAIFYLLSLAFMYVINSKFQHPFVLPGDIYVKRGTLKIYIPLASSLILSLILFLIFRRYAKF